MGADSEHTSDRSFLLQDILIVALVWIIFCEYGQLRGCNNTGSFLSTGLWPVASQGIGSIDPKHLHPLTAAVIGSIDLASCIPYPCVRRLPAAPRLLHLGGERGQLPRHVSGESTLWPHHSLSSPPPLGYFPPLPHTHTHSPSHPGALPLLGLPDSHAGAAGGVSV